MTLLRPTPSRRRWLNRFPLWSLVVAVALGSLLLVGLALLFALDDDEPAEVAADPCATRSVSPAEVSTTPPESGGTVNVLNSTDRVGLAAETSDELADRGFTIGTVTNAPRGTQVEAAAEVRHGPGSTAWARWVAAHVPGAELAPDSRAGGDVDLVLGEAYERTVGKKKAQQAFVESAEAASDC